MVNESNQFRTQRTAYTVYIIILFVLPCAPSTSFSYPDDAYFRGNRYILNNDIAVMLLFDSKGKIAGIQNGVSIH
jgi:hypothetical protein